MRLTLSLALVVSLTLNALLWRQEPVKCPKVQTFINEISGSYYFAIECVHTKKDNDWLLGCARSGRY